MLLKSMVRAMAALGILAASASAVRAAERDGFERVVVAPHATGVNAYPCMARLADGRLLAVWCAAPANVYLGKINGAFSNDHGRTWSAPTELIAGSPPAGDPSIVVSGKRVLVTATALTGSGISTSITRGVRSEDNGQTWSKPFDIPMNHRYTCGKTHRGLRLKSGTLLMGYSWDMGCEKGKTLQEEGQMHLRAGVMISSDDGLTWTNGGDTDATYEKVGGGAVAGTDEPAIVELDDGSIYMLIRTGADHLYEARSVDGGKTWTGVRPSPLKGSNAPAALCKFQVGDQRGILCVWDNAIERFPLCAATSFDGGKTWSKPKDIAGPTGGQQASYPNCDQATDGTLVAVWQQPIPNSGWDVRCARFTLDWLLKE